MKFSFSNGFQKGSSNSASTKMYRLVNSPKCLLCLYLILFLFSDSLNAQYSKLDFERLTMIHGFPSSPVSGIVQDKQGYLWIGTPKGLFRYNGNSIKAFLQNGSNGNTPDNRITQIEYIDDKVICLTPEGAFIHHCITEKDTSLYLSGILSAPAYLVNTMSDVSSDGHGGLILLSRAGFMHIDSQMHKRYEFIYRDTTESLSISGSFGRVIVPMPDGKFLILGRHDMFFYDPALTSTSLVESGTYSVLDSFITDHSLHVFELSPFEYIFLSRHQSTLLYYHTKQNVSFSFSIDKNTIDLLRWNTQLTTIHDSLYNLLMPGRGSMLLRLDKPGRKMYLEEHDTTGLRPITVLIDKSNRMWLGTHHGLYKQRNLQNQIRKSSPVYDAKIPEKSHVQFAISGNYLVTGTAEGLELKFYNKQTLALAKVITITPPDPTYTSSILHFSPFGKDSILICTNGPRIWLNTQTWQYHAVDPWRHIPTGYAWFAFQSIISGRLYTIQNSGTLDRYDSTVKKFVPVELDKDLGEILRSPTQIAEDWEGNLWLSHQGFCRFNLKLSRTDYCRHDFEGAWLDRNSVGNIVMDSFHQVMWFSLQRNGLIRYDPASHTFQQFTTKEGLPDLIISQMVLIDHHIWIISPSGLASMSIEDFTVRRYPYGIGAFLHFTRKALAYDPSTDYLYFMQDQDIMACRPRALLSKTSSAYLLIEQVTCGDSIWYWPDQHRFEIHGIDRKLRIQLSSISYDDTAPLQFSYRYLYTRDSTWRNIGVDGITLFENLRPGKHEIQFKLFGTGNDIEPVYKTIRIQVYPSLWESMVFRVIVAFLCLIIMWRFVRWQFQRKKANIELDRQLTELELKALRSRINPHFIFNCLNSINRYILKEDKGKASYYLSQFAKLIRHILDYTTEASVSLSEEINVTQLYIELESLRMPYPIQLEIQLDQNIKLENVRVPPLFIQPYVENAIWHGLAPKKDNLCLWVRILKQPEGYSFEIEDNGVGRQSAAKNKKTNEHISKGIIIARETLERYGQINNLKTNVKIVDLFNLNGSPRGTCVILNIESKT